MLRIPLEQIVVQAKVHDGAMQAEEFLSQAIEAPPPAAGKTHGDSTDYIISDHRTQQTDYMSLILFFFFTMVIWGNKSLFNKPLPCME